MEIAVMTGWHIEYIEDLPFPMFCMLSKTVGEFAKKGLYTR